MAANVWNYLAGYVIIKIEGAHVARLVNRAVTAGVDIWDIRTFRGGVYAAVSVGGFYKLRTVAREYPCRIHIVQKHGLTIALCHMRGRMVMAFGWIAALAALLLASRFMWFIEIEGCSEVEQKKILEILSDAGIKPGVRRGNINTVSTAQALLSADERIAWAGTELVGVVLQVSIIEAGDEISVRNEGAPCSIYAAQSGVITELVALSGKPMAKAGDAVEKGELLISGDLGNGLYVEARGNAEAKVLYRFSRAVQRMQSMLSESGESEQTVEIWLSDICLFQSPPPYEQCETEKLSIARMPGILPIKAVKVQHNELVNRSLPASDDKLRELARQGAEERLYAEVDKTANIIYKKSEYAITDDGVTCTIDVVTQQNIAKIGELYIR